MKEKFKSLLSDQALYTALVVVLVGILAFQLGRLSVVPTGVPSGQSASTLALCPTTLGSNLGEPLETPIVGETTALQFESTVVSSTSTAPYVASRSGTKYHHITCPGAAQIKSENKIYFSSIIEAQAAGYSKAANCDR